MFDVVCEKCIQKVNAIIRQQKYNAHSDIKNFSVSES